MQEAFAALGLRVPNILMPQNGIDLEKWAIVACDQFTSQPEYWQKAERMVGDAPSMLRMIYPEVYLGGEDRLPDILKSMDETLEKALLSPIGPALVLISRDTAHQRRRLGLMIAVDLEAYDFSKDSSSPIRATEGTILNRLPPRVRIREKAPIESPHILMLVDDEQMSVIEPLYEKRDRLDPLYDTPLMLGGGRVRGWKVDGDALAGVLHAFEKLLTPESLAARYHLKAGQSPIRFAVGDGNHSLATARACWLKVKETLSPDEQLDHPARFALVELMNVHEPALVFEPIHRVIFHQSADTVQADFAAWCKKQSMTLALAPLDADHQRLTLVCGEETTPLFIHAARHTLAVGTLQAFLDDMGYDIDYIHGEASVRELSARPDCCGFLLEGMDKRLLIPAVLNEGALPRKTFSMGEAEEKRYYLECRAIRPLD